MQEHTENPGSGGVGPGTQEPSRYPAVRNRLGPSFWVVVAVALVLFVLLGFYLPKYQALQDSYDTLSDAHRTSLSTISELTTELQNRPVFREFSTVSEYRSWVVDHVQRPTRYLDDAFLAAVAICDAGMEDGYVFGIDIDIDAYLNGESTSVAVTTFVDGELYWWYVEDAEMYFATDLYR